MDSSRGRTSPPTACVTARALTARRRHLTLGMPIPVTADCNCARAGGRASVLWVRPPGGASFGVSAEPFTGLRLTAAATVFVDVTRPRELLGLALRKSEAMHLLGPAEVQGWKLVDLVARAAMSAG